jgi:hypothetical protein
MKLIFLSAIAVATVSAISDLAEIRLAELLSGENDYVPGSNYKVDGPANNFNPAFLKNYNYGYTSSYANTLPTAYASYGLRTPESRRLKTLRKNYNYGYTSPYANTLPTAYASYGLRIS